MWNTALVIRNFMLRNRASGQTVVTYTIAPGPPSLQVPARLISCGLPLGLISERAGPATDTIVPAIMPPSGHSAPVIRTYVSLSLAGAGKASGKRVAWALPYPVATNSGQLRSFLCRPERPMRTAPAGPPPMAYAFRSVDGHWPSPAGGCGAAAGTYAAGSSAARPANRVISSSRGPAAGRGEPVPPAPERSLDGGPVCPSPGRFPVELCASASHKLPKRNCT